MTSPNTPPWPEALPAVGSALVTTFQEAGLRCILVGAAARRYLQGEPIARHKRLDFITDADPALNKKLAQAVAIELGGRLEDGRQRLLIVVEEPSTDGPATTLRCQLTPMGGARPFGRQALPPETIEGLGEPLARELVSREITLHAVAVDERGDAIDPFGGMSDLADQRLTTVLPVSAMGFDSPRWILRMARHVAYYGFEVTPEITTAARDSVVTLLDLPPEVWREEIQRALLHRHPNRALQFMESCGMLSLLLPEVQALVGFDESSDVHHKDLWEHTRLVVQKSRPDPVQRWAALFHDIGKCATREIDGDNRVHFLRHEDLGALLFEGIAARLRFPAPLAEEVYFLIRNHSRVNLYTEEWSDSAVRRLIREVGPRLESLLAFSRADITSRRESRVELVRRMMDHLEARIEELKRIDAREPALPKGIGHLIMEQFELPPSPTVGLLRQRLEEAVESGAVPRNLTPRDYVRVLARMLEEERASKTT